MSPTVPSPTTGKSPVGRPPALDATKREVVIALLTVGCTRAQAAEYLEISPQTISNTAKRDAEFAHQLDRAEADWKIKHLRNICAANGPASGRSWRTSAWVLQRMAPERFAEPKQFTEAAKRPLLLSQADLRAMLAREVSDQSLRRRLLERLLSLSGGRSQ